MRQVLNVVYRNTAEEFARSVTSALGNRVHSIVLYGSVARRRARAASDIDLLVVGTGPGLQEMVFDAAYAAMERSGFVSLITVTYFTLGEFQDLIGLSTTFISTVLAEGIVLHDDGTFAEARQRVHPGR